MNIFIRTFFFCFLLGYSLQIKGQQAGQYSMSNLDIYQLNVAYAGIEPTIYANGFYRRQWVGIDSGPKDFYLDAVVPLDFFHGGIGISVSNDNLGPLKSYRAKVSYNYILDLNSASRLSFGVGLGFLQQTLNGSIIRTPSGNYENIIDHKDLILFNNAVSANNINLSGGIFMDINNIGLGIAVNDFSLTKLKFKEDGLALILNTLSSYNMFVNYKWEAFGEMDIIPSVLFKTDLIESQLVFSIFIEYNYNIFGGIAFRGYNQSTSDAFIFSAGTRINDNFKVGYAYDLNISSLKSVNSGSHEIFVSYNLNKKLGGGKLPGIIYNPRY